MNFREIVRKVQGTVNYIFGVIRILKFLKRRPLLTFAKRRLHGLFYSTVGLYSFNADCIDLISNDIPYGITLRNWFSFSF